MVVNELIGGTIETVLATDDALIEARGGRSQRVHAARGDGPGSIRPHGLGAGRPDPRGRMATRAGHDADPHRRAGLA